MCHRPARTMENVIFWLRCIVSSYVKRQWMRRAGGLLRIHDCSVGDVYPLSWWCPPCKAYNSTQLNCCVLTRRNQLVMSPGHKIQKTNWNAIQLVMSPYLRLLSWWCLQGLQLNCCVLTRRKSGPIETSLSGHASAVLRVLLTKETLCVAWLLFFISTSSQSKVDEDTRAKFRYISSS